MTQHGAPDDTALEAASSPCSDTASDSQATALVAAAPVGEGAEQYPAQYHGALGLSLEGIGALMSELGQPAFRAKQLTQWLWEKGVESYDEMTNLSADLRAKLDSRAPLVRASIVEAQRSKDGTVKYLIEYGDGALVEAVGLPAADGRLTVCVSSQVGCALECTFCATGRLGLTRNLTGGEMAEQVRIVAKDFGKRVTNVVVMGQGEPFANYDQTLAALRIMNSPNGLGIGARHITVSTSGIVTSISRFGGEPEQFTLAVSLHSAVQATRDRIMPGLKNQLLSKLRSSIRTYSKESGRRPSLEYALVAGMSDTEDELAALEDFARSVGAHVNLIPINPIAGSSDKPTSPARAKEIAIQLELAGVPASVRTERGADIAAACGQLALTRREG